MKTKTEAEKKAEQLVRRHLIALGEESMNKDKTLNNAVACARVTAVTVVNTIRALFYINEKDYRFWVEVMELLATEDYGNITPLEVF